MVNIRIRIGTCIACIVVLAGCSSTPTTPTPPTPSIRVLVFSATTGFRHDSIQTSREVMASIGPANGITSTATEELSAFSAANLANYDVIMFAMTSGELPFTNDQKAAILDFVNGGKGFVGVHSATDTLRGWADYGRLVGAYVVDHPWTQSARVIVEDASHPAAGSRDPFTLEEEFYVFDSNPRGRVQVLLRLDAASVGATGDFPLAWAQSFGGGRAYYNALGHFPATWRDARFQAQVMAAIKWAGRRTE
jgi:type 1 glutamine amidotransferase